MDWWIVGVSGWWSDGPAGVRNENDLSVTYSNLPEPVGEAKAPSPQFTIQKWEATLDVTAAPIQLDAEEPLGLVTRRRKAFK